MGSPSSDSLNVSIVLESDAMARGFRSSLRAGGIARTGLFEDHPVLGLATEHFFGSHCRGSQVS
jgi:hypothetical protein